MCEQSPIRYGFRAGAKAIRYRMKIALVCVTSLKLQPHQYTSGVCRVIVHFLEIKGVNFMYVNCLWFIFLFKRLM